MTKILAIPWGTTSPLRAEVYLGNPKNFGNQLKYADKRQSPVAVTAVARTAVVHHRAVRKAGSSVASSASET